MKPLSAVIWMCLMACSAVGGRFAIGAYEAAGNLTVLNAFTNGVCTVEGAPAVTGSWSPRANVFTTNQTAALKIAVSRGNTQAVMRRSHCRGGTI